MSCIAAITDGKTVWLGGDAAVTMEETSESRRLTEPKVFLREDGGVVWGFGCVGSGRAAQLLRYDLILPPVSKEDEQDLTGFIVKKVIPDLRGILEEEGCTDKKDRKKSDSEFLIALRSQILLVGTNYEIMWLSESTAAIGSGAPFARGVLVDTEGQNPIRRLQRALRAAEACSAAVRGPFTIIHT